MSDNPGWHKVVADYLRQLHLAGISDLPMTACASVQTAKEPELEPSETAATDKDDEKERVRMSPKSREPSATPSLFEEGEKISDSPRLSQTGRTHELKTLAEQVSGCTKCPELVACRTQTVFGVGNHNPRLVFLGEGPGADEDRLGEPFVGRAGQLLNKIIEACHMQRSDVYIMNTVKCRPPGNRNPTDEELANCWNYAEQQLQILQPEFICCLGAIAAKKLLGTTESIGRLRQRFHEFRGVQVIVTYHPAYLLRNPPAKTKTWDDMKMLMDAMGIDYRSDQ